MTTLLLKPRKPKFSSFSFAKFSALSQEGRHKKCAEILRAIFDGEDLKEMYRQIERWMGFNPLPSFDLFHLSERFHYHLAFVTQKVREENLLIASQDKETPLASPLDFVIYLDRIRSAYNIGSILRTLEAFSLGKIAFSPGMAGLDHSQVQKAAMGAGKHLEIINLPLEKLPRPLIAFETAEEATPLEEFLFPKQGTLIFGNEEFGLSPDSLQAADCFVSIPLFGRKNSLNVACAFSVVAHTLRGQSEV